MCFRDLTIRVLGEFSNSEYALLAYRLGYCLEDEGLQDRAVFLTDRRISGAEMDAPYGLDDPVLPRRPRE